MKQISVVVADSSPFVCRLLQSYLNSADDIRVAGAAQKGRQMIEMVESLHPDVVTVGLEMPDMTGLQILQTIQQSHRTPAIVISGAHLQAASMTLEAMEHGAVDFVCKFTPGTTTTPATLREEIIGKVRMAAASNLLALPSTTANEGPAKSPAEANAKLKKLLSTLGATDKAVPKPKAAPLTETTPPEQVIVAGASTGGPVALRQLLSHFPADFPGSILVVQHLPPTFTAVLAEQLDKQLALPVKEAAAGDRLQCASVLITPGGAHVEIEPGGQLKFTAVGASELHQPSINRTMQSAAAVYGKQARGVLLTGMGDDGVAGLAAIRQRGGTTFAQAPASCTVKGMPQRAIEAGVVDLIAAPEEIARLLLTGY
jgi:two-component system chemotaxis response regulator CheB